MKYIWRFQCDPTEGDSDPDVTVFLGVKGELEGEQVDQKFTDPTTIKFSELSGLLQKTDELFIKRALDIQALKEHVQVKTNDLGREM